MNNFIVVVGHQSLTSAMELKGNILVSGNADSTVKVCLGWARLLLSIIGIL
jgi:hypothetical protein